MFVKKIQRVHFYLSSLTDSTSLVVEVLSLFSQSCDDDDVIDMDLDIENLVLAVL